MSSVNLDTIKDLLSEYVHHTQRRLDLILIGGLALQAYGVTERPTVVLDGELKGDLEPLLEFLRTRQVEMGRRFTISAVDTQHAADSAIQASPRDTALFTFKKIVEVFCQRIS